MRRRDPEIRTDIGNTHWDECLLSDSRWISWGEHLRTDFFGQVYLSSVVRYVGPEMRTNRVKMRRESNGWWATADGFLESIWLSGWISRPVFSELRSKTRRTRDEGDMRRAAIERQQMGFMRAFELRVDFFGQYSLSSVVRCVEPDMSTIGVSTPWEESRVAVERQQMDFMRRVFNLRTDLLARFLWAQ